MSVVGYICKLPYFGGTNVESREIAQTENWDNHSSSITLGPMLKVQSITVPQEISPNECSSAG